MSFKLQTINFLCYWDWKIIKICVVQPQKFGELLSLGPENKYFLFGEYRFHSNVARKSQVFPATAKKVVVGDF